MILVVEVELTCRQSRRIGKAVGGFEGRGIGLQETVGVGQFEHAVNHTGRPGEAEHATGGFQARETIHEFSEAATVEFGHFRKIDNDSHVLGADQFIERDLQLLAFDAHLERAAQLDHHDARLQFFPVD
jgi:hypothetical protein